MNRTTVRLSTGYSLLRLVNAVATPWDVVPVRILVQRRGMPVAVMATAFGVSEWHQITDLIVFLAFFCDILFFFLVDLALRELSSWELISGRSLRYCVKSGARLRENVMG